MQRAAVTLLLAGAVLLPLQTWPRILWPLPGMRLSDVFFALAFACFLGTAPRIPPARLALPLAGFAGGAALASLGGGSPAKLLGLFELCTLAWMAFALPPSGARRMKQALAAAAAIAAFTALLGLAAYFLGFARYDAEGAPDNLLLYIHGTLVTDAYPRPRGTLTTGAMLTSVVATGTLILWFEPALLPLRWLRRLVFAAVAVAMVFAFSREMVTLAVVVATFEVWRRPAPRWQRWTWAAGVLVYAGALWVSLRYHVVLDPLRPWAVEVLAEDGDRFARWRMAVAAIREHPLVGAGPGARIAVAFTAHDTWLDIWSVLGLVPLLAFAALMASAAHAAWRSRQTGLLAAVAFLFLSSLYNDLENMRHLWLVLGLAPGLASRTGPRAA